MLHRQHTTVGRSRPDRKKSSDRNKVVRMIPMSKHRQDVKGMHAKDRTLPMLVIYSDPDYRIPVEQGIGAFTALQAKDVPSAFLRFPDENH